MSEALDLEKDRLIRTTVSMLGASGPDNADVGRMADALFQHAVAEDLVVYGPEELGVMAQNSLKLLQKRPSDGHHVHVHNPSIDTKTGLGAVTVIDILNTNMPFLLSSILDDLKEQGLDIRLVLHPILAVERDESGALRTFATKHGQEQTSGNSESLISIHIGRIETVGEHRIIADRISQVLDDVQLVVSDWKPMLDQLQSIIVDYKSSPPPIPVDEIAEAVQFMHWLADNNFTIMGMRAYKYVGDEQDGVLERDEASGLGLLRDPNVRVLRRGDQLVEFTPEVREFMMQPLPLIVTKANVKSRVHRRVYLDYIGIKTFDPEGHLTGELRVVGLFTSTAYTRSTRRIPFLRRKVDLVMRRSGYEVESHSGKALLNVLESYPRDELFQIDVDTLYYFASAVLQLGERPRVRVLARRDKFDRFVSVLVFVPRDRYNTDVRIRIGEHLRQVFDGRVSHYQPSYPEGALARVHFIIGRSFGETPNPSRDELEQAVETIVRTWTDELSDALRDSQDEIRAKLLFERYRDAFSGAYKEAFSAEIGLQDLLTAEQLTDVNDTEIEFYPPRARHGHSDASAALSVLHLNKPVPLSHRVPILEHMGFRVINERTYAIEPEGDVSRVWVHDIALERADGQACKLETNAGLLHDVFMAIWQNRAENDGYNALVLTACLPWRDIAMLRAVSRYLRQVRIPYSQDYMWQTLNKHGEITRLIVDLFYCRLDPSTPRDEAASEAIVNRIYAALGDVSSLDEDRILRRFTNLVLSILRTNFFMRDSDGAWMPTIAFKLDSRAVDDMPEPRPYREIFVYSPRVEGVHLRFGAIARGGLRWSDRPQDFRTEVLGLVKAQQVKNAVIVPVGSKGGFVPKYLPVEGGREAFIREGTEAYKLFISSLLSITDNLAGDDVLPPDDVVRLDQDDPYLVVAADKGTATFSDTANSISASHDFWLGDAFASGGSAGYDHKKMGITARGGWEAVKRHFREMDIDIQTEPFSVVGVGDMSGDVFGNGMLLSKATKVVAAFDHRDIFIDPDPDPAVSWEERKRLFDMGRSSWQDYDASKISEGGGIYPRASKSIELSEKARMALGLAEGTVTPNVLMRAILQAKVDLLWFGGIGTYVRASDETDADADDRANDAIRLEASEVGARVVGEGANLGMTQKARIEFSMAGGRCNSDAIDNSAGVNSSDLEVNIKIAMGQVMRKGALDMNGRNAFLESMTDNVAELCLRNNYLQTLALSLTEKRGMDDFAFQGRLMKKLESEGHLDRAVEFLPDDLALNKRKQQGKLLTRPELGVLLAYAKIVLYNDLLDSTVPDEPYLAKELVRYFPVAMQEAYAEAIDSHRLRREIIATMLSNSMINRGGPTFVVRMKDMTGAGIGEIAAAFAVARDAYQLGALNGQLDELDTKIPGERQLELYGMIQSLLINRSVWFLRYGRFEKGLAELIAHYQKGIAQLEPKIEDLLPAYLQTRVQMRSHEFANDGVPVELAERMAKLQAMAFVPDMVLVSDETGRSLDDVAKTYFDVMGYFRIGRIEELALGLDVSDYYDRIALDRARDTLSQAHRTITIRALNFEDGDVTGFDGWLESRRHDVERTAGMVQAMTESGVVTVSRLTVAANLLSDLVRG